MNRYTPTLIWLILCLMFVMINMNCSIKTKIEPDVELEYIDDVDMGAHA